MDIDAQAFAPAIADDVGRRCRARNLCRSTAWAWRTDMIVPRVDTSWRYAGEHHDRFLWFVGPN
jgi:hypothetical protein